MNTEIECKICNEPINISDEDRGLTMGYETSYIQIDKTTGKRFYQCYICLNESEIDTNE